MFASQISKHSAPSKQKSTNSRIMRRHQNNRTNQHFQRIKPHKNIPILPPITNAARSLAAITTSQTKHPRDKNPRAQTGEGIGRSMSALRRLPTADSHAGRLPNGADLSKLHERKRKAPQRRRRSTRGARAAHIKAAETPVPTAKIMGVDFCCA